jgi:aspartyl-tRNA(Asn)/glutamyl-tRNA(Gln) amidotransferase subunit C
MTQISKDDVQYLARLSNLQLVDDEVDALRVDIENILGYIQQLSELDTTGVEPTYQVTDLENVWREDEIDDYGVNRETLIALAPESEADQIKVPKVL